MRLEVHLSDSPTFEHFDPEQIELTVKLPSGTAMPQLEEMVLGHPWTGSETYEVCCGHIFISDRTGKKVDAFTFGGTGYVHKEKTWTTVVFDSPAPIFEVTPINLVVDLFVDEVEILLAMRRAAGLKRHSHTHGYEERLGLAAPMDLYLACLQEVEKRLGHHNAGVSEKEMRLRSAIRAELQGLKEAGIWLGDEKMLAEVV